MPLCAFTKNERQNIDSTPNLLHFDDVIWDASERYQIYAIELLKC